jgi:hypothetical protein
VAKYKYLGMTSTNVSIQEETERADEILELFATIQIRIFCLLLHCIKEGKKLKLSL